MHPEIVREEPGSCPICGMALEPRVVSVEDRNPELDDMTRRFFVSALATLPLLLFMVSEMLPGNPLGRLIPGPARNWVELALATPVVLWGGWPFFQRGWASIVNRHLNMFTLIALGVGAAYGYSLVATLAPGMFPHSFRHARPDRRLLRARRRHRRPRAARTGARAARPQPHERGDSRAPRSGATGRSASRRHGRRDRRPPGTCRRRRSTARASGRPRARRRQR